MKKAITPIISIIILLFITVGLLGGVWPYMSEYFETMMKAIDIPPGATYCRENKVTIVIRNPGQSPINNSDRMAMLGLFHDHPDAVGAWRFEEEDGNATQDSAGNNQGSIYGDTILLMRFDEDDGGVSYDSTSYGNNGDIYGDTVFLMHFDENTGNTVYDKTSYGNDGTLIGPPDWNDTNCISGTCLEFNGAGDYVDIGSNPMPSSGDWTMSGWIWADSTINDKAVAFGAFGAGQGSRGAMFRVQGLSKDLYIASKDPAKGGSTHLLIAEIDTKQQWFHIAASYNSSTDKIARYVNGTLIAETIALYGRAAVDFEIGHGTDFAASSWWDGSIDEVAIYSRALTGDEINAMYEAGRAKFMEKVVPGRYGYAMEFDGVDDYVEVLNDASLNPPKITVELWAKSNTGTWNQAGFLVSKRSAYIMHPLSGSKNVTFYIYDGGWVSALFSAPAAFDITEWHHYVGTYDGSTIRIYVDGGTYTGETSHSGSIDTTDTGSLFIGRDDGSDDRYFNGSIDEVVIYSKALTDDEVESLYEAGRAKFIEWGKLGRFGFGMEFDGKDDYVDVGDIGTFQEITISWWRKSNNHSSRIRDFLDYYGFTPYDDYSGDTMTLFFGNGTDWSPFLHTDVGFDNDTWYHVVATYNGSTIKSYVDGAEQSETVIYSDNVILDAFMISTSTTSAFNGTIDEVVIINRSLSEAEIEAQLTPACSCSGNICECGDLTIARTAGEGYFHPYFDKPTIEPEGSVRMTDYNCMSDICTYRITSPAASIKIDVECS